jgi:hypothetical protein
MDLIRRSTFIPLKEGSTYRLDYTRLGPAWSTSYITNFSIKKTLWESIMGKNFTSVGRFRICSYFDVLTFINRLQRITGNKYELPTREELLWTHCLPRSMVFDEFLKSDGKLFTTPLVNSRVHKTERIASSFHLVLRV